MLQSYELRPFVIRPRMKSLRPQDGKRVQLSFFLIYRTYLVARKSNSIQQTHDYTVKVLSQTTHKVGVYKIHKKSGPRLNMNYLIAKEKGILYQLICNVEHLSSLNGLHDLENFLVIVGTYPMLVK